MPRSNPADSVIDHPPPASVSTIASRKPSSARPPAAPRDSAPDAASDRAESLPSRRPDSGTGGTGAIIADPLLRRRASVPLPASLSEKPPNSSSTEIACRSTSTVPAEHADPARVTRSVPSSTVRSIHVLVAVERDRGARRLHHRRLDGIDPVGHHHDGRIATVETRSHARQHPIRCRTRHQAGLQVAERLAVVGRAVGRSDLGPGAGGAGGDRDVGDRRGADRSGPRHHDDGPARALATATATRTKRCIEILRAARGRPPVTARRSWHSTEANFSCGPLR